MLTKDNNKLAEGITGSLANFLQGEIDDDELIGADAVIVYNGRQVFSEYNRIYMETSDGRGIWITVSVEDLEEGMKFGPVA